jgi:uncharacterized membrane protein
LANILIWWLVILLAGVLFLPLSNLVFRHFRDGGWLFSKAVGIFISAWLLWVLNSVHLLKFTQINAMVVLAVCLIFSGSLLAGVLRKDRSAFRKTDLRLVLAEELLFFLVLVIWVWIIGFRPQAYGTEKFMDYGLLTSLLRSDWMPAPDMWHSGSTINYYYGGQYITAFLVRLSGVPAGVGYNLMRATVASFSFVLPFSLVYEMMRHHRRAQQELSDADLNAGKPETADPDEGMQGNALPETQAQKDVRPKKRLAPVTDYLAGLLSGFAVAFCGNFHYVIYGIILPVVSGGTYNYWFPNSTRYIGYDPDTADKTIHEFPSYSTILGDLHAHYINIIFVLTAAAAVYAWALAQKDRRVVSEPSNRTLLAEGLLSPHIILIGLLTGLFRWTNFWDFPIYFVVCGFVIFFMNLRTYRRDAFRFIFITLLNFAEIVVIGTLASLPFTLSFSMISSEIHLTHSHSALYQLLILWGLPAVCAVGFLITLIREFRSRRSGGFMAMLNRIDITDLTAVLFAFCALGLVILPELIYVKDIYGADHYRSNTMFKLTYQAFILFGISMGYILVRAAAYGKKALRIFASVGIVLLALTGGYVFAGCSAWFGNVFNASARVSTDASVFISEQYPTDYKAIRWLNENVTGQPVVLEANGDSYSDYERVSVSTGLPTVLGWYVHEWLWRNDTNELNQRTADIETIYTSEDINAVKSLIKRYNIEYIFIGQLEREKFGNLNDSLLQSIGSVAYSDGVTTYILKVGS